jgi:glycosyltransferase involved in cell wall biosynthesis
MSMDKGGKKNQNIQLSIIVPVYNVEMYIRPCIESIFNQGLDEKYFEVIIINDGTEDRSMEMIQDLIIFHKNIIVINQKNQGISIARNVGIAAAKGEYILMPDSDDLLIENSLKPLLDIAIKTKADLVVADYLKMTNEEIQNCDKISQKDFSVKEKNGEQFFLEYLSPYECHVWRILFRRIFLLDEDIKFYPGIAYEDIPYTHECYLKVHDPRCGNETQRTDAFAAMPQT